MINPEDAAITLADLKQRLAALGDGRDSRSDRERDAYATSFHEFHRRITTIQSVIADCAPLGVEIAILTDWIDFLRSCRTEFAHAVTALPGIASERTQAQETLMMGLLFAIKNIDFGCEYWPNQRAMLAAPLREKICARYPPTWQMETLDPWRVGHGCLPHAEERLTRAIAERDAMQARLNGALQEPMLVAI